MAGIVNVGIVGYGMMGKHHASVWSGVPGVKVAAIVDPVDELKKEAAAKYGCDTFYSISDMLQKTDLDVVVVATHVPFHHRQTLMAIGRGCHVVCEKPMACTLEECDEMIALAWTAGVKLAVHHQYPFARGVKDARKIIAEGQIGGLRFMKAYGKGRIACSDLMEIGGHLTHLMRHLSGREVAEVYGHVTTIGRDVIFESARRVKDLYPEGRDSGIGAGDKILGYYKFSDGVDAELNLAQLSGSPSTFGEQRNFGFYVDIFGTAERLQLYPPGILFRNRSPLDDLAKSATPWEEVNPGYRNDKDTVLTHYFAEDFIRSIREENYPVVSGEDGRMAMEMTLGIYTSHLAGKPLPIPLENRKHPFIREG